MCPLCLAAQHGVVRGLQRHLFHEPADPQLFQRRDHAGEAGNQIVVIVKLDQHRAAHTGDQRARGVTVIDGGALFALNRGDQVVFNHRNLPFDRGSGLALGHTSHIAQRENLGVAQVAQGFLVAFHPALIGPFVGP